MRYQMTPSSFVEWIALRLGKVPLPIIDTVVPMIQAQALVTAHRSGLLEALAGPPRAGDALAARLNVDEECLVLLLRVLRGMGYVSLTGAGWTLSVVGRRHFGPDAREPYGANVAFAPYQWETLARLDEVLATGRGIDLHGSQSEAAWAAYQRAMVENAAAFAWFVEENVPVPAGARSCLDIAGSHGLIGARLCRRHPGLHSVVLDLPQAIATARQVAKERGIDDVVSFREGDILEADFGAGVDVALLCNILHHFEAETNVAILERVHDALAPGGVVGVFDVEAPAPYAPAESAADTFALMFRVSSGSRCFRADDYRGWLVRAGFQDARAIRTMKLPTRLLLVGTKRP